MRKTLIIDNNKKILTEGYFSFSNNNKIYLFHNEKIDIFEKEKLYDIKINRKNYSLFYMGTEKNYSYYDHEDSYISSFVFNFNSHVVYEDDRFYKDIPVLNFKYIYNKIVDYVFEERMFTSLELTNVLKLETLHHVRNSEVSIILNNYMVDLFSKYNYVYEHVSFYNFKLDKMVKSKLYFKRNKINSTDLKESYRNLYPCDIPFLELQLMRKRRFNLKVF